MTRPSLIGVYGGTFDPVHYGHLRVAEELVETVGLDRLYFMPAGEPRLRDVPAASAYHRAQMMVLATKDNQHFFLDEREIERSGESNTVESLHEYREQHGEHIALCFIIGADAFCKIHQWYHWRELFQLCHLIVVERPNCQRVADRCDLPSELQSACEFRWTSNPHDLKRRLNGMIYIAPTTLLDISATQIRDHVTANESIRYLLPDNVSDYIKTHHLYSGNNEFK